MNGMMTVTPIYIQGMEVNSVNARHLWLKLRIDKDFSNWIKYQIERARLVENRDFIVIAKIGGNPKGGRPAKDYHLTLDAAKHLAMMAGTEKGYEVREFFIEFEKKHSAVAQDPVMQMALGLQAANRYIEEQNTKLHQQQLVIEQTTLERDKAVHEKAWISEKREKTAMVTASVATRRANKFESKAKTFEKIEALRKEYRAFTNKFGRKCDHCGNWIDKWTPAHGVPTLPGLPWMHVVHARCFDEHLKLRSTSSFDNKDF